MTKQYNSLRQIQCITTPSEQSRGRIQSQEQEKCKFSKELKEVGASTEVRSSRNWSATVERHTVIEAPIPEMKFVGEK